MKPEFVIAWESEMKRVEDVVPKCCHTCCHYHDKTNICMLYKQDVPESFRDQLGRCEDWTRDPF